MAESMGHKIGETAAKVGHQMREAAESVRDWAQDKMSGGMTGGSIKEHMDVVASCGKKIGVVDHVQGDRIKLTKNASPDGKHHLVPMSWVDHVDVHVHLNKNSADVEREWQTV